MSEECWTVMDMPYWMEPIIVDINRPLEDQLPKGPYLDEALKILARIKERELAT